MDPRATPPPTAHATPDIRLRDPAGAVAAVPYLLGHSPRRSLVVIGVDDDRSVGASLRCDYEPGCSSTTTRLLWRHLERVLLRNGCCTSLVLLYTAQDPDDLPPGSLDALLGTVLPDRPPPGGPADARTAERLGVLDVLVVGPSRFRSVVCQDPACCPPHGAAVTDAGHHPVAAGFVLAGRNPAADRDAVAPEGTVSETDRDRALAAARAAAATSGPGTGARVDGRDDAERLLDRWAGSLPEGPDPELAGTLAAAWRACSGLRDACLAVLLPGGCSSVARVPRVPPTPGALAVLAGRPGAAAARLHQVLADPACARATQVGSPVLRRMAALTSGPERATVLAAHAWLCWVAGEGTAAGVLAERALREGHDQPLARLVRQCLDHGLGPPWTSARRAASAHRPPGQRA